MRSTPRRSISIRSSPMATPPAGGIRPPYPIDEAFLDAVGRMPPAGGVAIGLDRVLMLLLGVERIEDVLLFPAHGFV